MAEIRIPKKDQRWVVLVYIYDEPYDVDRFENEPSIAEAMDNFIHYSMYDPWNYVDEDLSEEEQKDWVEGEWERIEQAIQDEDPSAIETDFQIMSGLDFINGKADEAFYDLVEAPIIYLYGGDSEQWPEWLWVMIENDPLLQEDIEMYFNSQYTVRLYRNYTDTLEHRTGMKGKVKQAVKGAVADHMPEIMQMIGSAADDMAEEMGLDPSKAIEAVVARFKSLNPLKLMPARMGQAIGQLFHKKRDPEQEKMLPWRE